MGSLPPAGPRRGCGSVRGAEGVGGGFKAPGLLGCSREPHRAQAALTGHSDLRKRGLGVFSLRPSGAAPQKAAPPTKFEELS